MIIDGTALQGSADVTPAVALQPTADQITPVFLEAPVPSRASSAPPYSPPPVAEVGAAWHVAVGEGSQGPYTLDELASYVADGRIADDTLVYCESFADWTPAGAVEELMIASNALRRPRPSAPPPPPPQLTPSPYQRSGGMGRDPFEEREPAPASPRLRAEEIFDSKHEGTVQFSLDDMRAIAAVSSPSLVQIPTSPSSYTAPGYTSPGLAAPGYASGEGSGLIDVASLSAADPGPYRSLATDTHVSPLEGLSHNTPMAVPILGRPQGLDARTKVFAGLSAFGFVLVAAVAVIALSRTPAPQPVSIAATTTTTIAQAAAAEPTAAVVAQPVAEPEPVAEAEPQAQPEAEPAKPEPAAEKSDTRATREVAAVDSSKRSTRSSRRDRKHDADDASDRDSKSSARHGKDKDKDALPLMAKAEEPKPAKTGAKAASSGTDIDDILATPAKKPAKGGSPSIDDLLDGAVSAKKSPPKAEAAEPKNDLPMTPSRDDMLAALNKAKAKAAKCKGDGMATAIITLNGGGKVSNVAISGVEGAAKSCVETAVRGTTFPKFQKDSFEVKYPFKLAGG
jgi:hypothetical protein